MRNVVLFALSLVLCPFAAIAFVARPSLLALVAIALGLGLGALALGAQWLRLSARALRALAIGLAASLVALGVAVIASDAAIPWLAYPTLVAGLIALLVTTSEPARPRKPLGVGP